MSLSSARYRLTLTVLYLALWIPLAFEPFDRKDWLLENILVVAFAAFLIVSFKRLPFSGISYTLIFVFFCLHAVGAQSLRPPGAFQLRPAARLSDPRRFPARGRRARIWGYFLPLDVTMSTSMIYELIE